MPRPYTLVQLRYFQAVARHESMTVAARHLNVSQSALSTAMSQLEGALGVDLFIRRRNRSIVLSPAGRRLWGEVDGFLDRADGLAESARGIGEELVGSLRVGIYGPIAPFRLPVILAEFAARHPQVTVDIVEGDLERLHAALSTGECELALLYDLGLPEGFTSEVLATVPAHVLVAADHPAALAGGPVRLRDFAEEPLITLSSPHSGEYYDQLFASLGITPRVRHRLSGYETVRSFVAAGHGYAVLNQRVGAMTHAGTEAVALDIEEELRPIDVLLARPEGAPTRRAQAFGAVCAELYHRYWEV